MNRLEGEKSAYLRQAAGQKINWYPWSDEAFTRAEVEDKPVILSSGAVWCHWCHVMAKEAFASEDVAAVMNEHFVAIKIDRDERPDIDKRYQRALAAMGRNGGWPLTIFLTPDKKPFYGGTYFPLTDSPGRPGFLTVLLTISGFYKTRRDEVLQNSVKIYDFLQSQVPRKGKMSQVLAAEAVQSIIGSFDAMYGGFGSAPKFPMSGAIEFLIGRYFLTKDESVKQALKKTLVAMASGGLHDHLGGGFHRYSTDEAWILPHFEKMTDDNAWLLRNYVDAYALFGDGFFRQIAENIIYFIRKELSRPAGGFYASMDADVSADDEGGYYTWTDEDLRRVLTEDEYAVVELYFVNKQNAVQHNDNKYVLAVSTGVNDAAHRLNMNIEEVKSLLERGRLKLLAERDKRMKPFIDTALYTSLNSMMIAAFLKAYRILGDEKARDFALLSLERILQTHSADGAVLHTEGVKGLLEDYVHLVDALICAYEVSSDRVYLDRADIFMKICMQKFWDEENGGFFDTEEEIAGTRIKYVEDAPGPSANAVAAIVLSKLGHVLGSEDYSRRAERLLHTFSTDAQLMGIHGAYYFCALDTFFNSLKLDINARPESGLAKSVLSLFHPFSCILWGEDRGIVTPCTKDSCLQPVRTGEELKDRLESMRA